MHHNSTKVIQKNHIVADPCEWIRQFKAIARKYPEKKAICVGHTFEMTYLELETAATILANTLRQNGITAGHLVVIQISKSPEYLIALLAIWMCNAAFLPIDPELPQTRQQFYFDQANPNATLDAALQLNILHLERHYDLHLAYILFTSGSTGQPKGVMISHAGLVNVIQQQIRLFKIGPSDRSLWYLSTQFDASISDISTALLSGATLCWLNSPSELLVKNLFSILATYQITHVDIPPSVLATLDDERLPSSLKTLMIGGEVCPRDVVVRWARKIRLINIYGPTEATICTSMSICTDQWQHASLGAPIHGMEYLILNEQLQPSTVGELYIAGVGLALGYLNNSALTQAKFISLNHKTYYKTGDRVAQDQHGNPIYLGRIDRQLKIRGQLIAPEEIEATLYQHPSVQRAAVIFDTPDYPKQLLAIVEAKDVTANILRYFLSTRLPSWMLPNRILLVNQLPKNNSEKIDFGAIQTTRIQEAASYVNAVPDKTAQQLQQICQEVLALPDLPSIHDHIIDTLGANSLDIIKFLVCCERNGFYLSTSTIHHLPTLHDVSVWLQHYPSMSTEALSTFILKQEQIEHITTMPEAPASYHILLTGATGYLGIHILEELLQQTSGPITCLVRAKNTIEALNKIKHSACKYHRDIGHIDQRVQIVIGDMRLPQLGLDRHIWDHLSHEISDIYHCAAEVNMVKPFIDLKSTNLDGIKEIVRLAATKTRKKIFYMSSLSVFVATDQNREIYLEEDSVDKAQYVYGGYAQTKWAAEYYLQQMKLDVSTFRLGLLTGNSHSGQASDHDYLTQFVRGLVSAGTLPEGPWDAMHLDVTPVDFAAKAIVYLSLHAPSQCFHIANTCGFSLQMIVNALKKQGIILKVGEPLQKYQTESMATSYIAVCRLLSQPQVFERFRSMDLFQATHIVFDQKNTRHYLAETDIICPTANDDLLDKYLAWIYAS